MLQTTTDAPKREEQVLVLAAAGLTDKEIAIRLGISPDTVGTYWRRVLAKYQAASRTECVAKYLEIRNRQALDNLQYVNECMKLVNEHMIEHGVAEAGFSASDAILASLAEWVLVVDAGGNIVFSNRQAPARASLKDLFQSEDIDASLGFGAQGMFDVFWNTLDGSTYAFSLSPGSGSMAGHVVACGRLV